MEKSQLSPCHPQLGRPPQQQGCESQIDSVGPDPAMPEKIDFTSALNGSLRMLSASVTASSPAMAQEPKTDQRNERSNVQGWGACGHSLVDTDPHLGGALPAPDTRVPQPLGQFEPQRLNTIKYNTNTIKYCTRVLPNKPLNLMDELCFRSLVHFGDAQVA